jgi:hypothetical protein
MQRHRHQEFIRFLNGPSWIGGQKGNARCDVNCDDWTDRRLNSSANVLKQGFFFLPAT